jgi:hypothetical protein
MAVRKRVWLNTPYHNYTDKKKYLLTETEIEQYTMYSEDNTHWNYGDFVNSSCVTIIPTVIFNKQPNYMIILNDTKIEARYFVTQFNYISGEVNDNSKFSAALIRDVIVDYKDVLKGDLLKCNRGMLPRNTFSPILIQPEGLTLNEIKKDQRGLKWWDNDTQWLTLFYDINSDNTARTITFPQETLAYNYTFTEMQNNFSDRGWTLNAPLTQSDFINSRLVKEFQSLTILGNVSGYNITLEYELNVYSRSFKNFTFLGATGSGISNTDLVNRAKETFENHIQYLDLNRLYDEADTQFGIFKNTEYSELRNQFDQNKISNIPNAYLTMFSTDETSQNVTVNGNNNNLSWYDYLKEYFNTFRNVFRGNETLDMEMTIGVNGWGKHLQTTNEFHVNWTLLQTAETLTINLPATRALDEVNLGCVSIPFGLNTKIDRNGILILDLKTIKNLSTWGWTSIGTVVKDIQILPYCPMVELNSKYAASFPSDLINMNTLDITSVVSIENSTQQTIYYGVVCGQSSMDYRIPMDLSSWFTSDLKLDSMTKKCRLVSNTHKSSFEFNPVLNNGVTDFSLKMTVKPINTIYKIVPVFNNEGMYGGNFDDVRGLVYEGGFSLSQVTSAWVEYKLRNSTYQDTFNRDVKNLEVNQDLARAQETLSYTSTNTNAQTNIRATQDKALLSLVVGLGGTAAGITSGNPMASIGGVGALASAANSAIGIGAQKDIAAENLRASKESQKLNDSARSESLSYKSDQFALNNKSIMAQPSNLNTSSDYSSIILPQAYIEFYDCTAEEKVFLEQYLKYYGMKIGQIGQIGNYLMGDMSYLQGSLIYATNKTPIIANAINAELTAGCYIQEGLFND